MMRRKDNLNDIFIQIRPLILKSKVKDYEKYCYEQLSVRGELKSDDIPSSSPRCVNKPEDIPTYIDDDDDYDYDQDMCQMITGRRDPFYDSNEDFTIPDTSIEPLFNENTTVVQTVVPTVQVEKKTKPVVSQEYLKEKIRTQINIREIKELKNVISSIECNANNTIEYLINQCKNVNSYIIGIGKKRKQYYFKMGMLLFFIRRYNDNISKSTDKQFTTYIQRNIGDISGSTIKRYILFYKICDRYNTLITCDLTYLEIINNYKTIEAIITNPES